MSTKTNGFNYDKSYPYDPIKHKDYITSGISLKKISHLDKWLASGTIGSFFAFLQYLHNKNTLDLQQKSLDLQINELKTSNDKFSKILSQVDNLLISNNQQNIINQKLVDLSIEYFENIPKYKQEEYIIKLIEIFRNKEDILGNDSKILENSLNFISEYYSQTNNENLNSRIVYENTNIYNYEMEESISDISRSDISSFFKEIIDYIMDIDLISKILNISNYSNLSDMELLGISILLSIIVLMISVLRIILYLINDHIIIMYNIKEKYPWIYKIIFMYRKISILSMIFSIIYIIISFTMILIICYYMIS